ncbi:MAG TPA: hypothetical protein VIL46_00600 [Gemmataceae bacterium]
MTAERLLVLILRLSAVILLAATFAVFLPFSWMNAGHEALGLGPLPDIPLVHYLNRSIAALYAAFGAFTWIIAGDVRRFRPLVVFWGWFHVVFGAAVLGIDLHAGMPWFWTAAEGPTLIAAGLLVLVLLRRVRD